MKVGYKGICALKTDRCSICRNPIKFKCLIIPSLYNSNCLICLKLEQKDTNKSVLCCI
jgi:hypothetical protein